MPQRRERMQANTLSRWGGPRFHLEVNRLRLSCWLRLLTIINPFTNTPDSVIHPRTFGPPANSKSVLRKSWHRAAACSVAKAWFWLDLWRQRVICQHLCFCPTDIPSATKQKWWRTRWIQCGRLSKFLSGRCAMETMTGRAGSGCLYRNYTLTLLVEGHKCESFPVIPERMERGARLPVWMCERTMPNKMSLCSNMQPERSVQ